MTLCVILNTVVLAFDSHQNSAGYDFWSICNMIFTLLFTIEMLLKLGSRGFSHFIKDPMNIVDAFIVVMSAVELLALMTYSGF